MRLKLAGLVLVLAVSALAGGCIAVPVGPPVAAPAPVIVAPRPYVVAPYPAYGYYRPHYGYWGR